MNKNTSVMVTFMTVILSGVSFAGGGGADGDVSGTPPAAKSKGLDELTAEKLKRIEAQRAVLEEHYKIAEYNEQVKPLINEQNALVTDKCVSIGATVADALQGRCGVDWKSDYSREPAEFKFGKIILQPTAVTAPAPTPPAAPGPSPAAPPAEKPLPAAKPPGKPKQ